MDLLVTRSISAKKQEMYAIRTRDTFSPPRVCTTASVKLDIVETGDFALELTIAWKTMVVVIIALRRSRYGKIK